MQALRHWTFGKVLLTSAAWVFLCVLAVTGWLLFQASSFFYSSSEGAGVGAVSIAVNGAMLAIPIVPPIVLIAAWLVVRRLKSA